MCVEAESAAAGARWGPEGPSLWQEAEQEANYKAVGLQENSLCPRVQPVPIAVQQHQGHAIGPAKPLLEKGKVRGARPPGQAPKSSYGLWDPHLEAQPQGYQGAPVGLLPGI